MHLMKTRIEILADFSDLQKLVAMLKGTAKTPASIDAYAEGLTQLILNIIRLFRAVEVNWSILCRVRYKAYRCFV